MKFIVAKVSFLILILSLLFLFVPISKVSDGEKLYSLDPWEHLYFVEHGESRSLFSRTIKIDADVITTKYPSLMRTFIYILSEITSISPLTFFKYFGFVTRFGLMLLIYLYIFSFSKENRNKTLLIAPLVVFTSYYYFYRIWITFPENFAIPMHLISLIISTKMIHNHRNHFFWISLLSLNTSLIGYVHRPSFIVGIIIELSLLLAWIVKYKFELPYLKLLIWHYILIVLFCFPMVGSLIIEFRNQVSSNVGLSGTYVQEASQKPQYFKPTISTFIYYSSPFIIIFGAVGLVTLLKKITIIKIPLLVYFCACLFLSLSMYFNIFLPVDRMQGYLLTPLAIISVEGAMVICDWLVGNKAILVLMFFVLFVYSFQNSNSSKGWYALWHGEQQVKQYIENLNSTEHNLTYFDESINPSLIRLENPNLITKNINNAEIIVSKSTNKSRYDDLFTQVLLSGDYIIYSR